MATLVQHAEPAPPRLTWPLVVIVASPIIAAILIAVLLLQQ